jgi:hypothetical protein
MSDESGPISADDGEGPPDAYPLGYTEHELARLERQGAIFRGFTSDVLGRVGLTSGMWVPDVGCGVGDVSLLAAELVGSSGVVLVWTAPRNQSR